MLYVGLPLQSRLAVYTYDGLTGALTYRSTSKVGLQSPLVGAICWLRTNRTGTRLYALNSGEATVSVLDISNALNPVEIQVFQLRKVGPVFGSTQLARSSAPFHLTPSPHEPVLFVVSQHVNSDFSANYNYLHALAVGDSGNLSEPFEPVQPPVPATARPQGIVSLALTGQAVYNDK